MNITDFQAVFGKGIIARLNESVYLAGNPALMKEYHRVESALHAIQGVEKVLVNLESKNAVVEMQNEITDDILKRVIEEEGYQVMGIK